MNFRKSLLILSASVATFLPVMPFEIWAFSSNGSDESQLQPISDQFSLTELPLSESDRKDEEVLSWAQRKVKVSFSYNWVDYKEIIDKAKLYFTPQGYEHYLRGLKDSGSTQSVINKKLILQAKVNGAAKLLKQGAYQNKYSWQVEVPVVFTYYDVNNVISTNASIILLISRAPKIDCEDGLLISQLLLKPSN